jgi:hypothetical protein
MTGSPWRLRAVGGTLGMVADPAAVREALALFADPAAGCELMALRSGAYRILPGDDIDGLASAVGQLPGGYGIYFRVNPVPRGLDHPSKNGEILRRRWVYIDVDPVKAEGCQDNPATDEEKARTAVVCERVADYLGGCGWPPPVVADSGNGYGLFYPCDLPNDKPTQAILRRLLKTLAGKFSGSDGEIDDSVHNANRLAKLPGTWARKGQQSDDRPHRPCRLLVVPAELEPLSPDALAAACDPEEAAPAAHRQTEYLRARDEGSARRVTRHLCAKLALARAGHRNNTLNATAYTVGGLVGAGLVGRADAEAALFDAACRCGLDADPDCGESGIRDTIGRALEAGSLEPWQPTERPEPKPTMGKAGQAKAPEDADEPLTVSMSRVTPLQVDWLMRNRIAKRFITVMAGRTGIGKSFVTLDLIARISRGAEIPFGGGECFPPGGTLIISEDSHEYVLAPRLIDAEANTRRIHAMTWKAMNRFHLSDTGMLNQAADEVPGGISVVLIDPPTNFLADVDGHKDTEIRQLVMKVVEWALERNVAVLFILHVNKQAKGVEALNRVMGSVAWVTTSRVAHSFCPDPDDRERCLWVPMKNNLGPLEKAIAYRIVQVDGATRVEWVAEVDTTADEAMGGDQPKERRDVVAADWLVERFRENPEWESKDLFKAAYEQNVGRSAIFEAKRALDLPKARKRTKENGDEVWLWWVPEGWVAMQDELRGRAEGKCPTRPASEPVEPVEPVDRETIPD